MSNKKEELLYIKYKDSIYEAGGEIFIPLVLAKKFVDDCKFHKLAIVGIEGFSIDKSGIKPLLDYIADYSEVESSEGWEKKVEECHNLSNQFIADIKSVENCFLNFVLSDEDE